MGVYLYLSSFYIKCNQILDLQCPQAHLSSLIWHSISTAEALSDDAALNHPHPICTLCYNT